MAHDFGRIFVAHNPFPALSANGQAIYDGKHASLTQAFGPEARGSACSAQVIISDEPIEYPYVTRPDILVVMSQEACNRFVVETAPSGTLRAGH